MDSIPSRLLGAALLGGFAIGSACTNHVTNEAHCSYHDGNATCAARYGADLPYCGTTCLGSSGNPSSPNGDGCVDFRPDDGCYSPCGDGKDVTDDDSCLDTADTGTGTTEPATTSTTDPTTGSESSSADTTATTGFVGCTDSSECDDPGTPICLDAFCVPCGAVEQPDAACEDRNPDLAVCAEDGSCVQCTARNADACEGTTPICNDVDGACIGCTDHAQCGDSACAFDTGECLDGCHLDVDPAGPIETLAEAVGMVADEESCTIVIHGDVEYDGVVIDAGKHIAMLAAAGDTPAIENTNGRGIEVSSGSHLYAYGIELHQNTEQAISFSGSLTAGYLDNCRLIDNDGGGITMTNNAFVRVRNSIIASSGDGIADVHGLAISSGTVELVYTTVAYNDGPADDSIACSGTPDVSVRNSIVLGRDPSSIGCTGISVQDSAIDQNIAGNTNVGPIDTDWFANFAARDFHLSDTGSTEFAGIARWHDGDPSVDMDGQNRPMMDGAMDWAGADRP